MEPEKKSNGALIGSIIIIIILIAGGIYVWQSKVNSLPAESITPADSAALDSLEQELNTVDTNIEANIINSVE